MMLQALRARTVSARELLDLHLRRIERVNPILNAIVVPDYERAGRLASAADAARERGDDRPLLGLPLTLKESINRAGLPTTAGVLRWASSIAEVDAPVAIRVLAAGAVVLG